MKEVIHFLNAPITEILSEFPVWLIMVFVLLILLCIWRDEYRISKLEFRLHELDGKWE
jgi:hypothetical protein